MLRRVREKRLENPGTPRRGMGRRGREDGAARGVPTRSQEGLEGRGGSQRGRSARLRGDKASLRACHGEPLQWRGAVGKCRSPGPLSRGESGLGGGPRAGTEALSQAPAHNLGPGPTSPEKGLSSLWGQAVGDELPRPLQGGPEP